MKHLKHFLAIILLFSLSTKVFSQEKKVAVVTFYTDKMIDYTDLGIGGEEIINSILNLRDNPKFNLTPIMEKYHTAFFNDYAAKFPFKLLPEDVVTSNKQYQDFVPSYNKSDDALKNMIVYPNYKYIYEGFNGKTNEAGMANIFKDQADGVLFTQIHFALEKGFGIGGTATVKMKAYARIALYDKNGNKVFVINEGANSKKTGVMVRGIPVLSPDKILPMCESALEELLKDLDDNLPKIIKKSAKL
ncbi:hypothetical protein [Epilithonimonas sp. UC225_85]|uniref:hypothetical protein n=1 Tax=Epilithonimonas sp. UC225_85 TaxID=3350167 RepID=UPI0036D21E7D